MEKEIQSAFEHYQAGNYRLAEDILTKVLKRVPDSAEIHNNLGLVFLMDGKYDEAIEHFRRAIGLDPALTDANYNLGNAFKDRKQFDDAIQFYQKALQQNPCLAEAHNNIGIAFYEKGRFEEAIFHFRKAIELREDYAEAYFNMGNAFRKKKHPDQAMASYRRAVKINPSLYEAYNNLGLVLQAQGNLIEAQSNYRRVLQIKPDFAMAYYNIGMLFYKEKKLDEAITSVRRALRLNPDIDNAHLNLGIALYEKGLLDEALASYQQAVQQKPDSVDALTNLGIVLHEKQRLDEAMSAYRKILQLKPDDAEAHWNLSISLLLAGNYEAGWREYEWRQYVKEFEKREFPQPRWKGEDIRGRTILLFAEQGIGDAIQFIRYAPLVARKGAKVAVECQVELAALLTGVHGEQVVIKRGDPLPEFDMYCPLMSLPFLFNTSLETIPAAIPYIRTDFLLRERWGKRMLRDPDSFRVGLAWSGNPKYKHDYRRSCTPDAFACLANIGDITYFSLQKGQAAEQAKNLPSGLKLVDFMSEVDDFADTVAIIENLDLVISVDTAVAHLAGALGKTVWTLLPYAPDWRWMLGREDSPWYPTMRLFRQESPGAWGPVIEKVAVELRLLQATRL